MAFRSHLPFNKKKMARSLKRYCRRCLRVPKNICWICIFITVVTLISSYTVIVNDGEPPSDYVSERWGTERLHIVIRPELETTIIQPKLRYNGVCKENITPNRLLYEDFFKILILVTSAPPNAEARSAIRYTWANESLLPQETEVFFILGTTHDDKVMKDVEKEAEKYNDIIMEDFIDSYDNLTYKTLFTLKWAARNCFRATHLFKTDDDMLIIPKNLIMRLNRARDDFGYLEEIKKKQRNSIFSIRKKQRWKGEIDFLRKEKIIEDFEHKKNVGEETANKFTTRDLCLTENETERDEDKTGISGGYIVGKILRRVRPYRDRNSKWFIPYTLYNEDYLPDFASGTAYAIANGNKYCGLIKSLFISSLTISPVLPLEDVFVTGIAAEHLDLLLIDDSRKFSSSIPVLFPWTMSRLATCYYYDMVAIHGFKPNDMITGWKKLQNITEDECNSISGVIERYIYAVLAIFEMPNG